MTIAAHLFLAVAIYASAASGFLLLMRRLNVSRINIGLIFAASLTSLVLHLRKTSVIDLLDGVEAALVLAAFLLSRQVFAWANYKDDRLDTALVILAAITIIAKA